MILENLTKEAVKVAIKTLEKNKVYLLINQTRQIQNIKDISKNFYIENSKLYFEQGFNFQFCKHYHKANFSNLSKNDNYRITLIDSKNNKLYNINN